MKELDDELWKLGVSAKTKHNEVAPAQHELAPIFTNDQPRHRPQPAHHGDDEAARQHATAWSACCTKSPSRASTARASTTTGPFPPTRAQPARAGREPHGEPAVPRCSSPAVIEAVDEYQDLLRMSVATRRQRPPPGRQRGAAGHRLHVPRRRAGRHRGCAHRRARLHLRPTSACHGPGRGRAAELHQGHHRPQPHLALRVHRQQVRVPHARVRHEPRPT